MDGSLEHIDCHIFKAIQKDSLWFVCVFCSVLHILSCIKITEVEYLGLLEILLKTFL